MEWSTFQIEERQAIRCVLFDLGETLWTHRDETTETSVIRARNQEAALLLQSYFPSLGRSECDYTPISEQLHAAMKQRYQHWRRQVYDCEPDALLIMIEACQMMQLPISDQKQALTLFEAFRPPLCQTRQLFEDTLETLDTLQAHGIILGCVTDRQYGGKPFLEDLQALGLLKYFAPHTIVVSADCGRRKPHAIPFLQAISALGIVPEEVAMVGDFLSRDVAGAKKLNMTAIWKPKLPVIHDVEHYGHLLNDQDRKQKLFAYASQQEKEMYPEMPFEELEPFMQPDAIIDRPGDLLPLFL